MTVVTSFELPYFARNVLAVLHLREQKNRAFVVTLQGELGAGKTTFVQALAKEMGVTETVQSPTYVLMKSYPLNYDGFERLVHIDAYRLENPEQFAALRPEDFLRDPKSLVLIEWPERLGGVLSKPDMRLTFSSDGASEGERYIDVV